MSLIIGIDPAVHRYYVAWALDGVIEGVDSRGIGPSTARYHKSDRVLIEKPEIYHDPRSRKGDQNDLIDLAISVGEIKASFEACRAKVDLVKPKEWKGQLPKPACQIRCEKRLTREERALVDVYLKRVPKSKAHNYWDAIGILLHALGRGPLHG